MAKTTMEPMTYELQQFLAIHNLNNQAGDREGLIAVLEEVRTAADPENADDAALLPYFDAALENLREMSNEAFLELDLVPDFL